MNGWYLVCRLDNKHNWIHTSSSVHVWLLMTSAMDNFGTGSMIFVIAEWIWDLLCNRVIQVLSSDFLKCFTSVIYKYFGHRSKVHVVFWILWWRQEPYRFILLQDSQMIRNSKCTKNKWKHFRAGGFGWILRICSEVFHVNKKPLKTVWPDCKANSKT